VAIFTAVAGVSPNDHSSTKGYTRSSVLVPMNDPADAMYQAELIPIGQSSTCRDTQARYNVRMLHLHILLSATFKGAKLSKVLKIASLAMSL